MEIGLGRGDFVLDGDPAPPLQKGGGERSPQYSAHVRCGQTAGWIKMSVGMQVEQRKRHCVRWGHSSPPQERGRAPNFRPISDMAK